MKNILLILLLLFLLFFSMPALAHAQSNSVYNATTFSYTTQVTAGNTSTGSSSLRANPTAFAQGMPFLPYNLNAPITINRNAATGETITPSAISNCFPNSLTCTLSGTFTFKHINGESIQSGTFGLQEAINIAVAAGSGTVLIDASWQGPAGTGLITGAKGSTTVVVQDNRNPAGPVFYQWNGTNYVATGSSGGIQSINGDSTPAQQLKASGSGLSVNTSGGVTTYSLAGGGLTGTITSCANAHGITYFPATGTTVACHPNLWELDSTMSLSQINTLFTALNCGSGCQGNYNSLVIPDGVPFQPWTNIPAGFPAANPGVGGDDLRTGTHYQQMTLYGLVPDATELPTVTLTASSTTITTDSGHPFLCPSGYPCTTGGDVGKTISAGWFVGDYYDGTQYRFVPTIASVQSVTSATLSTTAPASASAIPVWRGTDNCTAFTNAMLGLANADLTGALATQGLMGLLPAGYMLTTCPVAWNNSQSWMGQNESQSFIVGTPATDVIQTSNVSGTGLYFGRMTLIPDGSISASQHPYTNVTANGTTTTVQPFYRPLHVGEPDSNNPLAQGWCATCDNNYVANITQNSGVICVPTALARLPQIGDEIVFPLTPTIFKSVVNSTAGSCSAGLSPITIIPAIPNTAGYTLTQTPFYASVGAAGIQHLSVAMTAGANNFPVTITLANPTYPYPGSINNVAPHGRIKIGNEEYDYMGVSYSSPYTLTLRAGPSSTAGWAIGTPVVPMNPCYADHETPYPVIPTVNTNDSTPSGAVFFPGLCGGNFGVASPDLDGLTDTGGSFFRAYSQNVNIQPSILNPGKGLGGWYLAGNHAPYASTFDNWHVFGGDFGLAQGPASKNEWNIKNVGPTGDGANFNNWSVTSAYILSIIGQQNANFNRWDAYSTEFSPFDGTAVGGSAAFYFGYTLGETNGAFVQSTAFDWLTQLNAEPENGSGIEKPPYLYSGCGTCTFNGASSFEGDGAIIEGSNNVISGGALSATASLPVIVTGSNNTITNTTNTATGLISNTYGIGSVLCWGANNSISVAGAYGSGQNIAPCPGLREPTSGYDSGSFRDGLAATPYVTDKEGYFSPYEFGPNIDPGSVEPNPFQVGYTIDPTAPVSGAYVGCVVSPSAGCGPFHIGGFFGTYYIGQDQRVRDIPYVMTTAIKTTSNQSLLLSINALTNSLGTCSGFANVINQNVTTVGGQWTTISLPANFTGHTGCTLQFTFQGSTSADVAEVAYMDFQPVPKIAYLSTVSSSIEGTSCPAPGIIGQDGSFLYVCTSAGTVKRTPLT